MHHFDIDWAGFLDFLPRWGQLSIPARRVFLDEVNKQPQSLKLLGAQADDLLRAKLIVTLTDGKRFRIAEGLNSYRRALRAMDRSRIFVEVELGAVHNYARDHLTAGERARLNGKFDHSDPGFLAERVISASWSEALLKCKSGRGWDAHLGDGFHRSFRDWPKHRFSDLKKLLRNVVALTEPLPLVDVEALLDGPSRARVGAALHAAVSDLLLFCELEPDELMPRVGLHPRTVNTLHAPTPAPPRAVEPTLRFSSAYLVHDITALVAVSAAGPIRLRQNDGKIFASAEKTIHQSFVPAPEELSGVTRLALAFRLGQARLGAQILGLMESKGNRRTPPTLGITEYGQRWLDLDEETRLRILLDPLRPPGPTTVAQTELYENYARYNFLVTPPFHPPSYWWGKEDVLERVNKACLDSLRSLPPGESLLFREYLPHEAASANPLYEIGDSRSLSDLVPLPWGFRNHRLNKETCFLAWQEALIRVIFELLLPLGCVELGVLPERGESAAAAGTHLDGRPNTLSLTPIGAYFLGLTEELELPKQAAGDVLILPNFEVVFMAPSPGAEGRLARFAERVGRAPGTVFRITRESVLAASGRGISQDEILENLSAVGKKGVPANVRCEVEGWLQRGRDVHWRNGLILSCPDEETASRLVAAVGGKKVSRLNGTQVELKMDRIQPALARKLTAAGLFLKEDRG